LQQNNNNEIVIFCWFYKPLQKMARSKGVLAHEGVQACQRALCACACIHTWHTNCMRECMIAFSSSLGSAGVRTLVHILTASSPPPCEIPRPPPRTCVAALEPLGSAPALPSSAGRDDCMEPKGRELASSRPSDSNGMLPLGNSLKDDQHENAKKNTTHTMIKKTIYENWKSFPSSDQKFNTAYF